MQLCAKHLHPTVPWAALIYPKLCKAIERLSADAGC